MKCFIIYNPTDPLSQSLVADSVSSCRLFKIEPELFAGTFNEIDLKLKKYNLIVSPIVPKITTGTTGCFISHYELWLKTIETNTPSMILEHDVVMQNQLPENILELFDDVLNLDPCGKQQKDLDDYITCVSQKSNNVVIKTLKKSNDQNLTWKTVKSNNIPGAYAYIIKPSGAKKLVDAAHRNGFLPADVHINSNHLTLNTISPSVFRICNFMIDRKNRVKFSSTKGYNHGKT